MFGENYEPPYSTDRRFEESESFYLPTPRPRREAPVYNGPQPRLRCDGGLIMFPGPKRLHPDLVNIPESASCASAYGKRTRTANEHVQSQEDTSQSMLRKREMYWGLQRAHENNFPPASVCGNCGQGLLVHGVNWIVQNCEGTFCNIMCLQSVLCDPYGYRFRKRPSRRQSRWP